MERFKEFHCWIKISRPPERGAGEADEDKNGSRPPGTRHASAVDKDAGFQPLNGPRPPGRFGGALMAGWWEVDERFGGVPGSGLALDYAPVPGDRDDAVAWISSPAGRTWLADAVTYVLMRFTLTGITLA